MSTSTNRVQMQMNEEEKRMQKLKLAPPAEQQAAPKKAKDTTASVWNPDWKYVPASETDLAKRFQKIRREQAAQETKQVIGRVK